MVLHSHACFICRTENDPLQMTNALYYGLTECHYRKLSIAIYKLSEVPSVFNEKSVGWNLNVRMLVNL